MLIMMSNKIYEPIRRKIEEWICYNDHEPAGKYSDNRAEHDEYRRWHDRDCVLAGGDLNADTMFSLWLPLRHTITRINDTETIRKNFCRRKWRSHPNSAHCLNSAWGERMYSYFRQDFQVFFDGDILPENIKDLSGSGDVRKSLAPDGIQPMEHMIDNYIAILQERRKYFTAEELTENALCNRRYP